MIGVFDSGQGGMHFTRLASELLPEEDFLFLGDSAYVPYGNKPRDVIYQRTHEGLQRLFAQGCDLVILACNTASAVILRERQQRFPEQRVLSVTIPGVERLVELGATRPLLLATETTIAFNIYPSVLDKLFPDYVANTGLSWSMVAGHGLVEAVEATYPDHTSRQDAWRRAVRAVDLGAYQSQVDAVILGCTHYSLLTEQIAEALPGLPIIDSTTLAAHALVPYLARHPEFSTGRSATHRVRYEFTGPALESL